jgi:hypothetical protein
MTLMENNSVQPGQTVAPTPPPGSVPDTPVPPPAPVTPTPEPQIPAPEPTPELSTPEPQPDNTDQQFDTSLPETSAGTPDDAQAITWTASEFIAHAKSPGWYLALFLAAIAAAALIFLVTRDPISSGVIIVAALLLAIYGGHKPRELEYRLDTSGLSIGQKHFGYHQFRSFSVLPEGAFSSIVFMPLKRFAVQTTIYYTPEDEDKIVNLIGNYLPLEERGHDAVDRLMHRIHF